MPVTVVVNRPWPVVAPRTPANLMSVRRLPAIASSWRDSTCSVSLFRSTRVMSWASSAKYTTPLPWHSISVSDSPVAFRLRPAMSPSPPPKPALLNWTWPS